jgi:hypothetical protein
VSRDGAEAGSLGAQLAQLEAHANALEAEAPQPLRARFAAPWPSVQPSCVAARAPVATPSTEVPEGLCGHGTSRPELSAGSVPEQEVKRQAPQPIGGDIVPHDCASLDSASSEGSLNFFPPAEVKALVRHHIVAHAAPSLHWRLMTHRMSHPPPMSPPATKHPASRINGPMAMHGSPRTHPRRPLT